MKNQNESLDESDFEYMQAERDVWKARYEFACADRKKLLSDNAGLVKNQDSNTAAFLAMREERDALNEAIKREEAQSVEPYAWVWEVLPGSPFMKRKGNKSGVYLQNPATHGIDITCQQSVDNYKWTQLFTRQAPATTGDRAALIHRLRSQINYLEGTQALFDMMQEAADMLSADSHNKEHHGWMMQGSNQVFKGEFAELDSKAEAKRCGGTCYAYPIYLKP